MDIELSSGKKFKCASEAELTEKLQLLKSGEDYLILDSLGGYIQCAISGSSLMFEYQDNSGHYSSSSALSFEKGEELLALYFKKDESWKNLASWESEGEYQGEETASSSSGTASVFSSSENFSQNSDQGNTDEPLSMGGLLNTIKKTAKKEVKRAVEKKTGGLVRDVFRKFTK